MSPAFIESLLAGRHPEKSGEAIDLISVFEAVGAVRSGKMSPETLAAVEVRGGIRKIEAAQRFARS